MNAVKAITQLQYHFAFGVFQQQSPPRLIYMYRNQESGNRRALVLPPQPNPSPPSSAVAMGSPS